MNELELELIKAERKLPKSPILGGCSIKYAYFFREIYSPEFLKKIKIIIRRDFR